MVPTIRQKIISMLLDYNRRIINSHMDSELNVLHESIRGKPQHIKRFLRYLYRNPRFTGEKITGSGWILVDLTDLKQNLGEPKNMYNQQHGNKYTAVN